MVVEVDVSWPQAVSSHELLIARRSLVFGVACQHALDAHADALNILYRAPSLTTQKVEADDAIRIDVRVHRYRSVVQLYKGDLRRLYGIRLAESELQAVCLTRIDRILIEDLNVEEPFLKTVGRDKRDTGWQALGNLSKLLAQSFGTQTGCHRHQLMRQTVWRRGAFWRGAVYGMRLGEVAVE